MKKKNAINALFLIIGFFFLFVLYFVFNFTLFDNKPIEISKFEGSSDKYQLAIYYVPSNATTQDYIQIRKLYSSGVFVVLQNFERYQVVKKYSLENRKLRIILSDTSSYIQRQDTILVNLPLN